MDAYDTMEAAMDAGAAWHVGIEPSRSQYIFTDPKAAEQMCAHLNSFPGGRAYRVRTQAEINAAMGKVR